MTYHKFEDGQKIAVWPARIIRLAVLIALVVAAILIFSYRDKLSTQLSQVLAASEEDPVPVAQLSKVPYELSVPAEGEIVDLESVPVPTPKTPSGTLKVAWLIPEGTFVEPGDVVVLFDDTDAQLNLEQQENTLQANLKQSEITTSDQDTNEKTLALDKDGAILDYDYAMTVLPQDETIFSKWDIIEAQINASFAKEKIDFLENKAKVQKRIDRSDQQILAIERNKAQQEINLTQETLNSLQLKTPAAGLTIYRQDHREDPQVGDEAQAGQVMVEVVNLAVLQAQIYVLERDGGSLARGQEVLIELDAIPEKVYHGIIRSVSGTAQSLERNSPLKYFTCEVSITDAGQDIKMIRPGMNVRAEVLLQKYDACFVVPATAVTAKNGDNLVYVQEGEQFVARPVEMGMSTHGQAVIVSGVDDGEIIALRNPFETRQLSLPDFGKATGVDEGMGRMMRMRGNFGGGGGGGGRGR